MDGIAEEIPAVHEIDINVVGIEPGHWPGFNHGEPIPAVLKTSRPAGEIGTVNVKRVLAPEAGAEAVIRNTPMAHCGLFPAGSLWFLSRLPLLSRLGLLLGRMLLLGWLGRFLCGALLLLLGWLGLLLRSALLLLLRLSRLGRLSGMLLLLGWLRPLLRSMLLLLLLLLRWLGLLLLLLFWLLLFALFLGDARRDGKQEQNYRTENFSDLHVSRPRFQPICLQSEAQLRQTSSAWRVKQKEEPALNILVGLLVNFVAWDCWQLIPQ